MNTVATLQDFVSGRASRRSAVGLRQGYGVAWWSPERLKREAERAARVLAARGIGQGDRVVLWSRNRPEWVAYFLGAILRRAVVVPAPGNAEPHEVAALVRATAARLTAHDRHPEAPDIQCPFISVYSVLDDDDREGNGRDTGTVTGAGPDDAVLLVTALGGDEPGSTIFTHRDLLTLCESLRTSAWRGLGEWEARLLCLAPLGSPWGLVAGLCLPLTLGASVLFTTVAHPVHQARVIRDNRVVMLVTVPTLLDRLERLLRRAWETGGRAAYRNEVGRTLRQVYVSGFAPAPDSAAFWRSAGGCDLVEAIGSCHGHAFATVRGPRSASRPLGQPVPGLSIAVDGDGELAVGREGRLAPTGTVVRTDRGGRPVFRGRRPNRLAPLPTQAPDAAPFAEEYEAVLNALDGIRDSVVVDRATLDGTTRTAVVIADSEHAAVAAVAAANLKLPDERRLHPQPVLWPESDFPRCDAWEIRRDLVVRRIRQDIQLHVPTMQDLAAHPDREQRIELLADYLIRAGVPDISLESAEIVRDLGFSSLDMVQLLMLLEERTARPVAEVGLRDTFTPGQLRRLVEEGEDPTDVANRVRPPPRWSESRTLNALRILWRRPFIAREMDRRAKLFVRGVERLAGVEPPFIVAGINHYREMDVFAIYRAMPSRLSERLMFVAADSVFANHFEPPENATRLERVRCFLLFRILLPATFTFSMISRFGGAREGLFSVGRLIDRGYCPIIFQEDPGIGLLAVETQSTVVPVYLAGDPIRYFAEFSLGRRGRFTVTFGTPFRVDATMSPDEVNRRIRESF